MSIKNKIIITTLIAVIVASIVYWALPKTEDGVPVIVTSSGVWYRAGNMLKTNPPLPVTVGRMYSTTTNQAKSTLLSSELDGYSVVRVYASTSDVTLTLPASSTLSTFIPNAGDTTFVLIKNASTTAGIDVGLVTNTGLNVYNATGTATATASKYIKAIFTRKYPSATNGTCPSNCDIDVLLDVAF